MSVDTHERGFDYPDPPWACPPPSSQAAFQLLEIRSGVQLQTHVLKRPSTLFGRAADQVDVELPHESCSRHHARIAFDSNGTCWLRDLGSTHGTTVNKKRLPPEACGKEESTSTKPGSRGVVVGDGDIFRFGASSRVFVVQGPPQKKKKKKKKKQTLSGIHRAEVETDVKAVATDVTVQEERKEDGDGDGVSWGIDMDDAPTASGSLDLHALDESKIPDAHRAEFSRLQSLRYKLQNVEQESERIRRKGEDNLSSGQERQLQRNYERVKALQQDIEEKERELQVKLDPSSSAYATRQRSVSYREEEEVEDLTLSKSESVLDQDGETEESLVRKWTSIFHQYDGLRSRLESEKGDETRLRDRLERLRATGEDEGVFFAKNDLDLAKDKASRTAKRLRELRTSLEEIHRLVKVANPSLVVDYETGYLGAPQQTMAPPPPALNEKKVESFMPPPPPHMPAKAAQRHDPEPSVLPPPKRSRILGPSLPHEADMASPEKQPEGTLAVLAARSGASETRPGASNGSRQKHGDSSVVGPPSKKTVVIADREDEAKRDVWKAPEGQDGSGATKLNAKFAGRY